MKVLIVTNMYPNPEQPAFGTFVYDQVEALKREGIEVDVLFVNGRDHKLNYVWGIFRLWWRLLRNRYQLIHAHYAITGLMARLQFLHPVIVTYHGGEVREYVPGWLRFLARRGHAIFDRIIVVNKQEKEILQNSGKVTVIPCGVDLDEFHPMPLKESRRTLGLPMDKPLVLWAGEYWQYEKRFELVEESLQVLRQNYLEAELVLVSGKPHSEVPLYMNACDVLLLTSRSEGSPMVIKEAMACNLPIVSTDVGDVAEVIAGVEGCHLVKPKAEAVADKLHAVLQWRGRTNGRDRIGHLGAAPTAQRIIKVYNEVCSPQHRFQMPAMADDQDRL
jgi:glycosyltransferase involved in cell wall biosynthesis